MESLARRPPAAVDVLDVAAARVRDGLGSLLAVTAACVVPAGALVAATPLLPQGARVPVDVAIPVLAVLLALTADVLVLGDDGLGQRPPVARSLLEAARRLPSVAVLAVVALLQVVALLCALVLPGLLRLGRLLPSLPVLLLERVRPGVAIRRADFLTRNTELIGVRALVGGVLAALAVAAAPVAVLLLAVPLPAGGSQPLALARALVAALLAACAVIPAVAATAFAVFLVRREQLEALDLQLALQSLDEATPQRPGTPALAGVA